MVQQSALMLPGHRTMTAAAASKLKSIASLTVLPILLAVVLFGLGRGLSGILAESQATSARDHSVKARHVSASPASFGTQRALADHAAELADEAE